MYEFIENIGCTNPGMIVEIGYDNMRDGRSLVLAMQHLKAWDILYMCPITDIRKALDGAPNQDSKYTIAPEADGDAIIQNKKDSRIKIRLNKGQLGYLLDLDALDSFGNFSKREAR